MILNIMMHRNNPSIWNLLLHKHMMMGSCERGSDAEFENVSIDSNSSDKSSSSQLQFATAAFPGDCTVFASLKGQGKENPQVPRK